MKAEAPTESSESEEEESQESDQEVTDEKLTEQFDRLKASVKSRVKPSPASVTTASSSTNIEVTGSQPARAHGDISRLKGILVAVLKLGSPRQGLVVFEDTMKSNRLPGNKVIIHGGRHAIELKILLHRQGQRLHLIQKDKEVEDDLKLTDLSESVRLHVLEEPILRGGQHTMNQGLVGNVLAGDPKVPCWLSPIPRGLCLAYIRQPAQCSNPRRRGCSTGFPRASRSSH